MFMKQSLTGAVVGLGLLLSCPAAAGDGDAAPAKRTESELQTLLDGVADAPRDSNALLRPPHDALLKAAGVDPASRRNPQCPNEPDLARLRLYASRDTFMTMRLTFCPGGPDARTLARDLARRKDGRCLDGRDDDCLALRRMSLREGEVRCLLPRSCVIAGEDHLQIHARRRKECDQARAFLWCAVPDQSDPPPAKAEELIDLVKKKPVEERLPALLDALRWEKFPFALCSEHLVRALEGLRRTSPDMQQMKVVRALEPLYRDMGCLEDFRGILAAERAQRLKALVSSCPPERRLLEPDAVTGLPFTNVAVALALRWEIEQERCCQGPLPEFLLSLLLAPPAAKAQGDESPQKKTDDTLLALLNLVSEAPRHGDMIRPLLNTVLLAAGFTPGDREPAQCPNGPGLFEMPGFFDSPDAFVNLRMQFCEEGPDPQALARELARKKGGRCLDGRDDDCLALRRPTLADGEEVCLLPRSCIRASGKELGIHVRHHHECDRARALLWCAVPDESRIPAATPEKAKQLLSFAGEAVVELNRLAGILQWQGFPFELCSEHLRAAVFRLRSSGPDNPELELVFAWLEPIFQDMGCLEGFRTTLTMKPAERVEALLSACPPGERLLEPDGVAGLSFDRVAVTLALRWEIEQGRCREGPVLDRLLELLVKR